MQQTLDLLLFFLHGFNGNAPFDSPHVPHGEWQFDMNFAVLAVLRHFCSSYGPPSPSPSLLEIVVQQSPAVLRALEAAVLEFVRSAFPFLQLQLTQCLALLQEGVGKCEASIAYQVVADALHVLDFFASFTHEADPFTPLASLGVTSFLYQVVQPCFSH